MQERKKIIILGAGVGGLTVAHELSRFPQYDISIYERHDIIGGMARSRYKKLDGKELPTEYCWRIYGPNYDNLREILKQIPLHNDTARTVHDNLINLNHYLIADQGSVLTMNNRPNTLIKMHRAFRKVSLREKWQVFNKILYCFMISTERLDAMDAIAWCEYINPNKSLSHDMKKYIIDIMGPYLGAESRKVNVPSVAKTLESFKLFNKSLSVLSGPTNDAWLDHWKVLLEKRGVNFHLNSEIVDITSQKKMVSYITLANGEKIVGDAFFCGLSIESIANMPSLKIPKIKKLAKHGHQLMVGIQLYFNRKIILPYNQTALYIPDSPWQIVIEPQGAIWQRKFGDVKDIWSIGLCDPVRAGIKIKKPFIKCSHEEIKNEVWHQITSSEFYQYLNLTKVKILAYNVWDSYVYNGQEIKTYEPKFSTNKGTLKLRPNNVTRLKNFYFSTAYTKTSTDMFEMESAAEAGKLAAKVLEKSVNVIECKRPLFFAPYRYLDKGFSKWNIYQSSPFLFYLLGLPLGIMLCLINCFNKK